MRSGAFMLALTITASSVAVGANVEAAGPGASTLAAWDVYVAATEERISRELGAAGRFLVSDYSSDQKTVRATIARGESAVRKMATLDHAGRTRSIPGGTVAHWAGAVLVPGISLDALVHKLQHPAIEGPYPDDVVSLRVLERRRDQLTLAMRLTRRKIVTVTYDTIHATTYRRLAATRASSRSVSTRIAEVSDAGTSTERVLPEGEGRGFLWRMRSYWRYEEVPAGVIVELESLTLSRSIPTGLGMMLEPLVDRIARESIVRTLDSMRRLYGARALPRAAGAR
jgi:hypothetical protein